MTVSGSNSPQKTPSVGTRIRQSRKKLGLTLAELADQCNISPSFLSQIERDHANPSVTTLYAIAQALDVSMGTFFEEPDRLTSQQDQPAENGRVDVVRSHRRKILIYPGSGIRNELLSPDLQRALQMMWVVMPPGTDSGDIPFVHLGEECGVVLQGQLETWVGDNHYMLGPGDAIYHDSTLPHRSRNAGDTDVIMVVAKTPPSF